MLVGQTGSVNAVVGCMMSSTRQRTTLSNRSAAHDSLIFVSLNLSDLITLLPLTISKIALLACASAHTELSESTVVMSGVDVFTLSDTIILSVDRIVRMMRTGTRTIVLLRIPVAVAVVVGIAADPLVDAVS